MRLTIGTTVYLSYYFHIYFCEMQFIYIVFRYNI